MRRRKHQSGLTLIELIVVFTILSMLAAMAVPLARHKVRRDKERELRQALHELRIGIDKYKDACDAGKLGQVKVGTECYPETIEILVEGAKQSGRAGRSNVAQLGRPKCVRRGGADFQIVAGGPA